MIDLRWSFLVVSRGNFSRRSKRACAPKTDSVPGPGAIVPRRALFQHEPEKIVILAHAGQDKRDNDAASNVHLPCPSLEEAPPRAVRAA